MGSGFRQYTSARLRVFHQERTYIYNTRLEATKQMAETGLLVRVLKLPETLLEQIKKLSWSISEHKGKLQNVNNEGQHSDRRSRNSVGHHRKKNKIWLSNL